MILCKALKDVIAYWILTCHLLQLTLHSIVFGDSLYSGEADADSYTWEWCPPNYVGPLGTKRYIKAPQLVKGFGHRVLIEKDGCSVYTGCYLYTGIENYNDLIAKVEIFPNPNQGSFIIETRSNNISFYH